MLPYYLPQNPDEHFIDIANSLQNSCFVLKWQKKIVNLSIYIFWKSIT